MPDIRLRIELLDTEPLVWRRVVVPEQINLQRLHDVIQAVMGWEDEHLFEFECNGRFYGEPDEWAERPISLARNAKLKTIATRAENNTFHYLYDFGDDWRHRIVVEETGLAETNPCPRLVDGEMACPPEDIGGMPGLEALKDSLAGRPNEHGEMVLESLGGEFDLNDLDNKEIAFMLAPIQNGFRRGGGPQDQQAEPPTSASDLDMERSLKAQGIHSLDELKTLLWKESDRNGK